MTTATGQAGAGTQYELDKVRGSSTTAFSRPPLARAHLDPSAAIAGLPGLASHEPFVGSAGRKSRLHRAPQGAATAMPANEKRTMANAGQWVRALGGACPGRGPERVVRAEEELPPPPPPPPSP